MMAGVMAIRIIGTLIAEAASLISGGEGHLVVMSR